MCLFKLNTVERISYCSVPLFQVGMGLLCCAAEQ